MVSDDHAGLRQAIIEVLPAAPRRPCSLHFPRTALDDVRAKVDDDGLRELRWLEDRRDLAEARRDGAAWLARGQATGPQALQLDRKHIEATLTVHRLPRQHHKHLNPTTLPERLNEEIKRRTHVVGISPHAEAAYG